MMPGPVSQRIIVDRLEWVARMTAEIAALPLVDEETFLANDYNGYVAESCLRRALEALLDIGRHILARQAGKGPLRIRRSPAAWANWASCPRWTQAVCG